MANATKRGTVGATPFNDDVTKVPLVSTAQVFYANAMVGFNTSGYGDKMDDAAVKHFAGVVASVQTEVLSGGADGDVMLDVVQPRFITATIAAATEADKGRIVYASDDQTVSLTPGAFGNVVGRIAAVISSTVVVVECIYDKALDGGKPLQVLAASGAVPIKTATCVITKAGVAALTLADPTAGKHDGVEMTFISATANAHTLDNSAGSGFNGGGAASDVGTFAAAKGNGITVVAYQGVWYVKASVGVTLA